MASFFRQDVLPNPHSLLTADCGGFFMKTRIIHTKVWIDSWFSELNSIEKLLFIFFITNERIGLTGAYECSDRLTSFYTGISSDEIKKAKEKLIPFIFIDNWVIIKKAHQYSNYTSNDKLKMAYNKEFQLLPDNVKEHIEEIEAKEYVKEYKKSGGKYLHRKIAEKLLGRKLLKDEIVHHIDKNSSNNDPSNLAVMKSDKHTLYHKGDITLEDTNMILVSYQYDTNYKSKIINNKYKIINNKPEIRKLKFNKNIAIIED